jgi:hypothetical protein
VTAVSAAGSHRKTHSVATPAPDQPSGALLRVRRIGYLILGVQLIGFLVWSTILYRRFAVTYDFAQYQQAWYLIAHGHFDPYDTVHGFAFWQNHGELEMWMLALFFWIWPHSVTLLWLQDVGVVVAELLAFIWTCELVQRNRQGKDAAWLAGVGLLLLAINPWIWWTVGWDFHTEPVAMPFAVLLLRDLMNGRRRAFVWTLPLLACGDVADTYIAAAGVAAILAGRRTRRPGLLLACIGAAGLLILTVVHGNLGSGNGGQAYDYLAAGPVDSQLSLTALIKGITLHPTVVLRTLWAKHTDIWSNLSPDGLIGLCFVWVLPIIAIVMMVNMLWPGLLFTAPSFQYLPLYILMPVATVAVLAWLLKRRRWLAVALAAIAVAQAIGWAAVWDPQTPGQWLRVPVSTAQTLATLRDRIPATAEVVASQGVVGGFADREYVYPLFSSGDVPVKTSTVWFVITPYAGIEVESVASALQFIAELAGTLRATLITHANGVWVFRWTPPADVRRVVVPAGLSTVMAWTHPGLAGRAVTTGSVPDWHVASTGQPGYVADQLEWRRSPGIYRAAVSVSTSGPVNVEVWNDNCNALLARRTVSLTTGVESVTMAVNATAACPTQLYSGWGPLRVTFIPPPPGQELEIRVWSPGNETVSVYRASLVAASSRPKS